MPIEPSFHCKLLHVFYSSDDAESLVTLEGSPDNSGRRIDPTEAEKGDLSGRIINEKFTRCTGLKMFFYVKFAAR